VEDWREEESSTKRVNNKQEEDRGGDGAKKISPASLFPLPHPQSSRMAVKHGGSKMAVAR